MKCPKCGDEFPLNEKSAKFCPSCGVQFREVTERITMRPSTDDGSPIMVIDTKAIEKETPRETEVPPSERWQGEHLRKEMENPDAFSYIPENAVTYDTDEGHLISHRQVQTVKPIKIPTGREQKPDFIPKGAVTEEKIMDEGNITISKVEAGGEITVEKVKLIDNPVEKLIKPMRPKFSEIVEREDIDVEQKVELLHVHGYSEHAIQQWVKKVLKENEKEK